MNFVECNVEGAFVTWPKERGDGEGVVFDGFAQAMPTAVTLDTWHRVVVRQVAAGGGHGVAVAPFGRMVSVASGRASLVVVELRSGRPATVPFAVDASAANSRALYVPAGCGLAAVAVDGAAAVVELRGGEGDDEHLDAARLGDHLPSAAWAAPGGRAAYGGDVPAAKALPVCLFVGASGQVGEALAQRLASSYTVVGTFRATHHAAAMREKGRFPFDLAQAGADGVFAEVVVAGLAPALVVVCGAMTHVDGCEAQPQLCELINARAPANLAAAATGVGAKTVFFSSEYVFDGKNGPYGEDDAPCPINVYGHSKLAGEIGVAKAAPSALICRTTVVYGPDRQKKNFACQLLRNLAGDAHAMNVPNDQVSSPTYNRDLAEMVALLLERGAEGIFHTCGPEVLDRAAFAVRVAAAAGVDGSGVRGDTTAVLYAKARAERPLRAGMKVAKCRAVVGDAPFRPVEDCIAAWIAEEGGLAAYSTAVGATVRRKVWYAPNMHQAYGDDEINAVVSALRDGWLAPGPLTAEFERVVADYFGKKAAVMTNSGSAANIIGLAVLGIPPGAEVVTPALTFSTALSPITQLGLVPVFVDSVLDRYVPSVEQVVAAITPKTRVLFIPNLGGGKIDWKRLRHVVHEEMKRPDIVLFEDSCDTMTHTPDSDVSAISFYASHIITAGGCGGCVMFRDPKLRERALQFRDWGRIGNNEEDVNTRFGYKVDGIEYDFKFLYSVQGYNMKCCEMNAAFGLVQMRKLARFTKMRADNIARFVENLRGTSFLLPADHEKYDWLAMPLQYHNRGALLRYLEERNVQVRCFFAGNITRHPAYREYKQELPVADAVMRDAFLIGAHHGLTTDDVDDVCAILKEFEALDKAGKVDFVVTAKEIN